MSKSMYWFVAILAGYLIGYYFRSPGNMTVGRVLPSA